MDQNGGRQEPAGAPDHEALSLFDRMNNYILLLYALSCFLMYASLSVLLYLNWPVFLSLMLPGIFGIAMPLYLLSRRFDLGFAREFAVSRPDAATAAIVFVVACGAILPADLITWLFERNTPVDDDYISFLLAIKPKGAVSFLLIAAGIGIISPFAEELLFRGYIQRIFHRNMPGMAAVALGALVFAASHSNVRLIPGTASLGLVLGYLFYRTGNLFHPFLAHAVFNLSSLVRLSAVGEEALRDSQRESPSAAWVAASLAVLAAGILMLERKASGERKKGDTPSGAPPV